MSTSLKPPVAAIVKREPTITYDKKVFTAYKVDKVGVTINFDGPVADPVRLEINRGSFSPDRKVQKSILDPGAQGIYKLKIYSSGQYGPMQLKVDGKVVSTITIRPTAFQSIFFDWIPTIIAAVITAFVIKTFGVASYYIPSESMVPTLEIQDRLLVNRFSYRFYFAEPERGDIMVFRPADKPNVDFIKRVIGVPGDEIQVKDGAVFVNGEKLEESYIKEPPEYSLPNADFEFRNKDANIITTNKDGEPVVKIPEGYYFMLGDNRNDSNDSHVWGLQKRKDIQGKALFIFWPFNRVKLLGDRPTLMAVSEQPAHAESGIASDEPAGKTNQAAATEPDDSKDKAKESVTDKKAKPEADKKSDN